MIELKTLQDAIAELASQLQDAIGLEKPPGPGSLAKYLGNSKGLSESTLSHIQRGIYEGNLSRVYTQFTAAAAKARATYGVKRLAGKSAGQFFEFEYTAGKRTTSLWADLQSALTIARENAANSDARKLIWVVADPGFGKTTSMKRLAENDPKVSYTEGRESWRNSYFSVLTAMARALGLTVAFRSAADAEEKLFAHLKTSEPRVICLDEVEFCGKSAVNLWRKLMNETNLVMVVFCLPQFFDEFHRLGGVHTAQLMQRNVCVLRAGKVQAAHAKQFLSSLNGEYEGIENDAAELANAANGNGVSDASHGGGYRLTAEVAKLLAAGIPVQSGITAFRHAQGIIR